MPETVADLSPAPYNPRIITEQKLQALNDAMNRFGDLSGVVFNRRTGRLIGGHQRTKHLPPDARIQITYDFGTPNDQGTVRGGFIEYGGERWTYREVDVNETTERAMNIAANKHGGEFDLEALSGVIQELNGEISAELLGFQDEAELSMLLAGEWDSLPPGIGVLGGVGGIDEPSVGDEEQRRPDGSLLALADVAIAEPTHQPLAGEVWRLGPHVMVIADVLTQWSVWKLYLEEGSVFVPYPGPYVALTEAAESKRFVMVQPDIYIAGHILDKYAAVKGEQSVRRQDA